MRIRKPGKITDGLWFLGDENCCVYLVEGENGSILINGGVSFLAPRIAEQLREFRIDESRIGYFLILHSHFDHIGVLPFFQERHPDMVILGSQRTGEVLAKPRAVQAINDASRYATEQNGMRETCEGYRLDLEVGMPVQPMAEGESIDLGGIELRIVETPGHSPCSVTAYIPQLGALFPSDAGGVPNGDRIATYGTSNYSEFERSLRKLALLDVRYLCSDHCGVVAGVEAAGYVGAAMRSAAERRQLMLDTYRAAGSLEEAARQLAVRLRQENIGNIVPFEVFQEAHRLMIMHVTGL